MQSRPWAVLCWCVGEFGWRHGWVNVAYKTLMQYCQENGIGWIAWSWAGNGGIDKVLDLTSPKTFSKNDLTGWGEYLFYSEYGIQRTSKMAYTYETYKGSLHEIVDEVTGVDIPQPPAPRNATANVTIDVGEFKNYEWKFGINGDPDDEVKITCAGMPKECYKYVEWKKFKQGFTCGGKLTFKHVVGGVKLVETDFTIKYDKKLKKNIRKI